MEKRMQRRTVVMTEGVIWKQLLLYAFPLVITNLLQQTYNTVDLLIVGNFIDSVAMGAVGSTGYVNFLLIGFFIGLSTGATVVVAQFFGAKREEDVSRAVHTAAAVAILSGAILVPSGIILSPVLLRVLNTPAELLPQATLYMRIYFCSVASNIAYNIGAGVLRAVGDSRRPLYFLLFSIALHLSVNLLLVGVFRLGVAGAALTTVISQTFSAVLVWVTLARTKDCYRFFPRQIRLHRDIFRQIIAIGVPAGLQSTLASVSNITMQAKINTFGADAIAGFAAANRVYNFVYTPISAFGLAITNFVGQNVGAGKFDRVRKSVTICLFITIGVAAVMGLIITGLGRHIIGFFNSKPEVVEYGFIMCAVVSIPYWIYSFTEIYAGALKGVGSAVIPMVSSLFFTCILRVIWIFTITVYWNSVVAVLSSYTVGWVTNGIVLFFYYRGNRWMEKAQLRARELQSPAAEEETV